MKKTAHLILLIALVSTFTSFAQDVIYTVDGGKIEGKISLVGTDVITYKKTDNPTGPDYVISKQQVLMLIYENGNHETFNATTTDKMPLVTPEELGCNLITWNFLDLLTINMSVSYERFMPSGKFSWRIPFSMGFDYGSYADWSYPEVAGGRSRVFLTGFGINYYPTGQGKSKYFVGPSLDFSINRFAYDDFYGVEPYYPNPNDSSYYEYPYTEYHHQGVSLRTALHINNGWLVQPTKNFSIVAALGLGIRTEYFEGVNYGYNPSVTLRLAAGYRF